MVLHAAGQETYALDVRVAVGAAEAGGREEADGIAIEILRRDATAAQHLDDRRGNSRLAGRRQAGEPENRGSMNVIAA